VSAAPKPIDLVGALRPTQWTKNLVVFAGAIFAMRFDAWALGLSGLMFLSLCLISGSTYVANDLRDIERDRLHPRKRTRPIASGAVSPMQAGVMAAVALAGGLGLAWLAGPRGLIAVLAYVAFSAAYQLGLKQVFLLDVLVLAAGFAVRAAAGAFVISVPISPWLIVCSMLLAMFLALAKRRHELAALGDGAEEHRPVLASYTVELVDEFLSVTAAATIVAYSLYTFIAHPSGWMMITIPYVVYGVMRYLYLVHIKDGGGSPEVVLVRDVPMLVCVGLWIATSAGVLAYLR